MGRLVLLGMVLLAAAWPAAAEEFEVGGWFGNTYYDDDGQFSHCAMSAEYDAGDTLIFVLSASGELHLALYNESWSLPPGETYGVGVRVDDKSLGRYSAEVVEERGISLELPYTREFVSLLMRGNVLTIATAQRELSYRLTNTSISLPRLERCLVSSLYEANGARNPFDDFGPSTGSPFGSSEIAGAPAEADEAEVEMIRLMLLLAGLDDYEYLPPDRVGGLLAGAGHGWTDGDTIGAMYMFDNEGAELPAITAQAMAGLEPECDGEFTYGVRGDRFPDGTPTQRVLAKCDEQGEETLASFILFNDGGETAVIVHFSEAQYAADLTEADEKLYAYFKVLYSD